MPFAFPKRIVVLFGLVVIVPLFGSVAAGWYLWSDRVPQGTIDRLPHATEAEVREWLGQPDAVDPHERYERWFYRTPFRLAEFRVDFSPDGRVEDWSYDR